MAAVVYADGNLSFPLGPEDFSVLENKTTGKFELLIPCMAVELSCEGYADTLVKWILRDIETAERLGS